MLMIHKWWRLIGLHYLLAVFSGTWALASPNLQMEPREGLAPSYIVYKTITSLSMFTRQKCLLWMDLNHRPMHYRAFTVSCTIIACTDLPTELHNKLEYVAGLAPAYMSFAETALTISGTHIHKLVRNVGVEPTTEPWQSPVLPLN